MSKTEEQRLEDTVSRMEDAMTRIERLVYALLEADRVVEPANTV